MPLPPSLSTTKTVMGPAGAPMRPFYGSFVGKPLSASGGSRTGHFSVMGPGGAPMHVPYGPFNGKFVPSPVTGPSVGAAIGAYPKWRLLSGTRT